MNQYLKLCSAGLVAVALITGSCSKLLEEQPESSIVPSLLSTPGGLISGIAGVYADMRNLWGTEGFTEMEEGGTDETLAGGSASDIYFFNYDNLLPSDMNGGLWNIAYQDINTLNGVIQFASVDTAGNELYIAQAKFLRAFYYYHLVETFGAVPLHITYITKPSTNDYRATLSSVYAQMVTDLNYAIQYLNPTPSGVFLGKPATIPTAMYLLSKVYLTRGWSTAKVSTDFDSSAIVANNLIANAASYGIGLWQDFASNFLVGNEEGKESLMDVEYSSNTQYGSFVANASGGTVNGTAVFFRPNYPTINANYPASGGSDVMVRNQNNGRPFIRIRPNFGNSLTPPGPDYILDEAFDSTDRVSDTRYSKTFQTVWLEDQNGISTPRGALVENVDTAIWTPPYELPAAEIAAFKGIILTPQGQNGASTYSTVMFPAMKKYDDSFRVNVNDPSPEPLILFRFAEVYLIAAEADYEMGDLTDAAAMLNVIRERAAYSPNNSAGVNAANATAMDITPADVTLTFILDERTRELYGEGLRWWDLVRTQSLLSRVQQWNPQAQQYIQPYSILRPIPENEITVLSASDTILSATSTIPWQNPGYGPN